MSHENKNSILILENNVTEGSSDSQIPVPSRGKWTDDRRLAAINAMIKYRPFQQQQNHKLAAWNKVFEAVNATSTEQHRLGKTSIRQQIHTLVDSVDELNEASEKNTTSSDTTPSLKERTRYLCSLMKTSNRKRKRKDDTDDEKPRQKSMEIAADKGEQKDNESEIQLPNTMTNNEAITASNKNKEATNSTSGNGERIAQDHISNNIPQPRSDMERILAMMERTVNAIETTSKTISKALDEHTQATISLVNSQQQIHQQLIHLIPMRFYPPFPYYPHSFDANQRYFQAQGQPPPPPPQQQQQQAATQQQLAPRPENSCHNSENINNNNTSIIDDSSEKDKNSQ